MGEPLRLRYHQRTFDLLRENPMVSTTNVQLIESWERQYNIHLPSAVREWYSLQGAEKRGHRGPSDFAANGSIREVLKQQTQPKDGHKVDPTAEFSVRDIGDHGIGTVVARFDGSEDPTVFTWVDPGHEWYPIEGRGRLKFSDFVFLTLWELLIGTAKQCNTPYLETKDAVLGPIGLDFLTEYMTLFYRERRYHGKRQRINPFDRTIIKYYPYRSAFRHHLGVLLMHCQANPGKEGAEAIWHLLCNSDNELFELAKFLWPIGHFSNTLTAVNEKGEKVLGRLREYYDIYQGPH